MPVPKQPSKLRSKLTNGRAPKSLPERKHYERVNPYRKVQIHLQLQPRRRRRPPAQQVASLGKTLKRRGYKFEWLAVGNRTQPLCPVMLVRFFSMVSLHDLFFDVFSFF